MKEKAKEKNITNGHAGTEDQNQKNEEIVFDPEQGEANNTASNGADANKVDELIARIKELEEKNAELQTKIKAQEEGARERYLRQLAETDNFRKRMLKEQEEYKKKANERLVKELLPVLDNLQRALEAADQAGNVPGVFLDGIHMVEREFLRVLDEVGVRPVESEPGIDFDPTIHEALNQVETEEQEPGTVVRVLQRGYKYHDRLLRPALVSVATEPEKTVPGFVVDLKEQQPPDDDEEEEIAIMEE